MFTFNEQVPSIEKSEKQKRMEQDALQIENLVKEKEVTHIVKGEVYPDEHDFREKVNTKLSELPANIQDNVEFLMMTLESPYLYRDFDDRTGNGAFPVATEKYADVKQKTAEKLGYDAAGFLATNKLEGSNVQTLIKAPLEIAEVMGYSDLEKEISDMRLQFHGYASQEEHAQAMKEGLAPMDSREYNPYYGHSYKSTMNDEEKIAFTKKAEHLAEQVLARVFEAK